MNESAQNLSDQTPAEPASAETTQTAPTETTSGGQQHLLTFWLRLVDQLITAQIRDTLEEHGLTRTQWLMMNSLDQGPKSSQELASEMQQETSAEAADPAVPQSAEEHLEELVESGWLVHEGGLYTLTSTGRASGERVAEVVQRLRAQASEGMDEGEFEAVLGSLERMARNLGWTGDAPRS